MTTTPTDLTPQLLTYRFSSPRITAFSTLRQGGVSTGPYAAFNIAPHCGDTPAHVRTNHSLLARHIGLSPERIILPHQVHQTRLLRIDSNFFDLDDEARAASLEGVDALCTDMADVCIGVSTADCIPILLADTEHHAIAAVHAGWRGTVARIAEKAVAALTRYYGTRPERVEAVIGPGISQAAFEVGDEVYEAFSRAGFNMKQIARREAKWHIDLWAANYLQLENCGLRLERIQVSGICTYSHSDRYFSARRLGTNSGRIFSGILQHP